MKKRLVALVSVVLMLFSLSGFTSTDEKEMSIAVVYCVAAVLSVVVFLLYVFGIKKKSPWFILLFTSVFVVNIGYFSLAVSSSLEEALLANRISYLGSVFLPMSMLLIISEVIGKKIGRLLTGGLIAVGIIVFLIAASPGYIDIYYKEVTLVTVNGVSMLNKVYGPLHIIYLFYLLIYFLSMIIVIASGIIKKRISDSVQAVMLLCAVFVNIGVWLLEQFVKIDFEVLSVSYVITELFLVLLCFLTQESEKQKIKAAENQSEELLTQEAVEPVSEAVEEAASDESEIKSFDDNSEPFFETDEYKNFMYGLGLLTNTEKKIYNYYVEGKSTKEIMELLNITENTLKYHNKNIYGKLGVTSRKQLKEIAYRIHNINK